MEQKLQRHFAVALPVIVAGLAIGAVLGHSSEQWHRSGAATAWGQEAANEGANDSVILRSRRAAEAGASDEASSALQGPPPAFPGPFGPPPEGPPVSADEAEGQVRSALERRATVASVDVRRTTAGSYIRHRGAFLNWEAIGVSPDAPAWVVTATAEGELYPRDAGLMDPNVEPTNKGLFVVILADNGVRFAVGLVNVGDKYDQWRLSLPGR